MNKHIKSRRGPLIMAIDVTYKCNLKCLHCFNFSGENNCISKQELTDDELLEIADSVIKLSPDTICLCGGEPILRGDVIYKLGKKISDGTLGRTSVNMVTNGQAIDKNIALNLKQSGFSLIQVSLDGPDAESCDWIRNKKNSFEKICNSIKTLIDVGLKVNVSCCPTRRNFSKIRETIDLATELGVSAFRIQPLMNIGRAQENLKDYMLNFLEYKKIVDVLEEYKSSGAKINIEWGDPVHHLTDIAINDKDEFESISVNAYGEIVISPYIPITFGDVRKYPLEYYWENGLKNAHNAPFFKEACRKITTSSNMDLSKFIKDIPRNYKEESLSLDIIDTPELINCTLSELIEINKRR